jgi:eukaryotic-like serine/threonine-protein kinase
MSSLHQRAKDVFLVALAQSGPDRSAFLADACGDDTALRAEVESLLHFHETTGSSEPEAHREDTDTHFAPGQMFAGRYRMVARIGRGGMGDVWRADDVILQTPVALKLIASTANDQAGRILNEVRVARQITHPAVCRVFDVGNADGVVFFTMELVDGEDLAALVRRVGRLPSEKVNDIARQLCGGLAAAHAQGVLHRDLKPGNVLIDNHGQVRITDFGIAIWQAQPVSHSLTGTPAYMAPEQRTIGATLSPQTDIYALGLVLYELLVGQHPFKQNGVAASPALPSSIVPSVDPPLERVIMEALSIDPVARPASATEFATRLGQPVVRPSSDTTRAPVSVTGRRLSWWAIGPAIAAAAGIIAVALTFFVSPRAGARTLTAQDTIVIADFENTTNEPVFDGALKVALAVALEQSPFLRVFPDDRARDTLRLMERSPDERITRILARDIARREQLKALISGSIASLGRNYVIALEAVNADTGDVMAREQAEATSKEQVLTSLGAASTRLRERLGESLASVQKFDAPLPRATTPSLDALHAYSLALSDGREVPRLESIPQLKRAIELDPTFAMAHAQLSAVYANTYQSALAPAYSKRAFELRDRVSERERFFISWRYYRDAVQAWDRGLELARSWTAAYPREAFAFNSLGAALIRFGDFDASVEAFRQAIRLDPKFVPAYGNLAASLLALDRPTEARAVLQDAAAKQLDFAGARRLSYLLAFVQGDSATMARELEASLGAGETNAAGWQAQASAFEGHIRQAHEEFGHGIESARRGNFNEVAAQLTIEDAEFHAIVGQCREARNEASVGLALSRDNGTLEHAGRALAICGAEREALELSSELAKQFPEAIFTNRLQIPLTAAAIAIERGDAARAIELLEPVRRFDHAPSAEFWPAYLRGQAYLQLKNGPAAAAEFRNIIAHRGEVPASMLYPLSHLGLARASALANDTETARKSYEQFLTLWKTADAELGAVKQARSEQAALR